MKFTHLHVHSEYSLLDGMTSVEEMYSRAEELGQDSIALTDHGMMSGIPEFLDAASRHPGVKPIAGCEIYLTDHYDHNLKDEDHKRRYHLVLLARNLEGYRNLCAIVNEAGTRGMYRGKPRVSHAYVASHNAGLVCLSACIGGEIPQRILEDDIEGAREALEWYRGVFGEDFYLEVMLHRNGRQGNPQEVVAMQEKVNAAIFRLSAETGVKTVATNDVHFASADQADAHDCFLAIQCGRTISDENRLRYTGEEYIKSADEMLALFPDHPEAIAGTQEVADKVERYSMDIPTAIPAYPLPEGYTSSDRYLSVLAGRRVVEKYGDSRPDVMARLEGELFLIRRRGCADYFLHLMDMVRFAREEGIPVGPGRGAAAGFLVNWCLGITEVDPVERGLLSERMYNMDSRGIPDVDFDFGPGCQKRITAWLEDRFGKENVTRVVTFGTMTYRNALKNVLKAMGLPFRKMKEVYNLVPETIYCRTDDGDTVSLPSTLRNLLAFGTEFSEAWENGPDYVRRALHLAAPLENRKASCGIHACAVAVLPGGVCLPAFMHGGTPDTEPARVSQYDGHWFENTGAMRLDILELQQVGRIAGCLSAVEKSYGVRMRPEDIPADAPEALALYASGKTAGLFQFESRGLTAWLKKLPTVTFDDLVALNAMYRPGPMDWIGDYVMARRNCMSGDLPAWCSDIFAPTCGIPVFQEQIMQTLEWEGGFTPEEADSCRKDLGRRRVERIAAHRERFMAGGLAKGHPKDELERVWSMMEEGGRYAFNRAHAECYTLVSCRCAWLKAHFPKEFDMWFGNV